MPAVRQIVTEALCLSVIGGVLGLAIPLLTGTMLERSCLSDFQLPTTIFDWRLLAFAGGLSIATGLLFSLGPALQSSRASTAEALQQNARSAVGTGTTGLFRDGLVVLQVAATVVLLVAAGLMLRTLANLRAIELGFTPDRLLTMQVSLPQPKYADETKRNALSIAWWPVFGRSRAWKARRLVQRCRSRALATRSRSRSKAARKCLERFATRCIALARRLSEDARRGRRRGPPDRRTRCRRCAACGGCEPDNGATVPSESERAWTSDSVRPRRTVVHDCRCRAKRSRTGLRAGRQACGVRVVSTGWCQPRKPCRTCVGRDPLASATAVQRVIQDVDPDQPVRLIQIDVGCRVADGGRSPATHDAARRVWRARDAHRLDRSLWSAGTVRVRSKPRDRLAHRPWRNREECRDDGDVARNRADNYRAWWSVSSWPGCSRERCRRCCLA